MNFTMIMAMAVVMMAANEFVGAEGVEKQEKHQDGAEDAEPSGLMGTTILHAGERSREPLGRQQIIDAQSKGNGSDNDGEEINSQRLSA